MFGLYKWIIALACLFVCGCGSKSAQKSESHDIIFTEEEITSSLPEGPIHQEMTLHSLEAPAPEVMTLYSIDGLEYGKANSPKYSPETEFFHRKPVLGKKVIHVAHERQELWDVLNAGIRESDGIAAACFSPRHGLRIERAGVQTDYVICFECFQIEIYSGDKHEHLITTTVPQPVFNRVLKAAGIPIARGAE